MNEEIFSDEFTSLRVCISGMDRDKGTVAAENFKLTIYAYRLGSECRPLFTHVLDLDSARRLFSFLQNISLLKDLGRSISGKFVEIDRNLPLSVIEALRSNPKLSEDPELIRSLLELNPDLCRSVLETRITSFDIDSIAYRRDQLKNMKKMLEEPAFFAECQERIETRSKEATWQNFFEENQWILGYGLNYVIGDGVRSDKLEQVVAGYSIAGVGKRVDALLQTRGLIRSLCYVEIKTHDTMLLKTAQYRPDVWQPSSELSGAVSQSQKTVQLAIEHLQTRLDLPMNIGLRQHQTFFNYAPRSVVVCGTLKEFIETTGVNRERLSSFELYRRNIHAPEIVTFDELYDRSSAIVELGFNSRQQVD